MSTGDATRTQFVETVDPLIAGSAGEIFDAGRAMAGSGASREAIRAHLAGSLRTADGGSLSDEGACADYCAGSCDQHADTTAWYDCYTACYERCIRG